MQNRPRKHHVVPEKYLALFSVPQTNKVAILDLQSGEMRDQRPKEVLHRRDYYRQKHAPPGKDQYALERAFGAHLEANLPGIIQKISSGGRNMAEEELIQFVEYLQFQRLRVPKQLNLLMKLSAEALTEIACRNPGTAEWLKTNRMKIVMKDEHRFEIMRQIISSQKLLTLFTRMTWRVWTMPPGITLVTTDNPVVIFNPALPGEVMVGPGRLGSRVLFPFSPFTLLELVHPETETDESYDPLEMLDVRQFRDTKLLLRTGNVLPLELAESVNRIMTRHADRFVVASSREDLERAWSAFRDEGA